ncbi:integrase [Bradyrhizobium niftali]|uniref:tyrosine-type recombinase/integrase n=1 Tax=Bradyrhizobium niftali TaxID=2560055 RepID=UPI003838A38A
MKFKLNPKEIDSLPPGTHGDGNNLYLVVKDTGARAYILRYQWQGRPQKMGLGAAERTTLAEARDMAIDANRLLAKGINPREARDEARHAEGSVLFGDFAEELRLKREKGYKHKAHRAKWRRTVHVHAKPLHKLRVDRIATKDIEAVLLPIWQKTPVAARDVRQHLEAIFNAAKALKLRSGDNPAAWKGNLQTLLPVAKRNGKVRGPHRSLPYEELPAFMRELATIKSVGARMLETCILTCSRTNEIIHMRWSDVDMERAQWRIPASMMKMDRDHVVPLSRPVMAFLGSAYEMRFGEFVFPGLTRSKPMSNMTMLELLKDMPGRDNITVHGFRACFKTWADEETEFSNQAVEFCLAHVPGDEAEKAYRRGSMLAKRVQIMAAWATFATKPPAKVINIDDRCTA